MIIPHPYKVYNFKWVKRLAYILIQTVQNYFYLLKVVGRGSDAQLKVGEKLTYILIQNIHI